jgi:hypothetical protein
VINASFDRDGFVIVPSVLSIEDCALIIADVSSLPGSVVTRSMLRHGWCPALADQLRRHAALAEIIPARHAAVQCTYFDLLLHASSKSNGYGRRRVLHFRFGPREPGYGLRWQHGV